MDSSAAPRSLNLRLIALSQLACVVLFGALLIRPWQASSLKLAAAIAAVNAVLVLYGTYA